VSRQRISVRAHGTQEQDGALHKFHDLFSNRAKHQRSPSRNAVRRNDDHINIFAIDDHNDVASHVVSALDADFGMDAFGNESTLTRGELCLGISPRLLEELCFRKEIVGGRCWEHRNDVQETEFRMKVLGEIGSHFQSCIRGRAEIGRQENSTRNGMGCMCFGQWISSSVHETTEPATVIESSDESMANSAHAQAGCAPGRSAAGPRPAIWPGGRQTG